METRTVLFVDDERGILDSLRRLVRGEPYEAVFAGGGEEALEVMREKGVCVVVSDLTMPGMDGVTFLKQVEQTHPEIVRLVLSARSDTSSVLDAVNNGRIYGYILKPWEDEGLKLTIKQALNVFDLQQEKRDLLGKLEEHNRLLEKRVEERTAQLLAVERHAEIGKYASHIVHNVNNPLQVINGGLEIADLEMDARHPDLEAVRRCIDTVKSGVQALQKIVKGILLHVRDNRSHAVEDVDLNRIIERELDFFKLDRFFKYDVEKQVNLSNDLPRFPGNPLQIKQIVDNLLKNSLDAMEGSLKKRLTIETGCENSAIVIRVSDTGEGIAEEDLSRIFSPDFTTKPIGKGTGLGLASVKAMVEAYSGEIKVESVKGRGTTFTIRLPARESGSKTGRLAND